MRLGPHCGRAEILAADLGWSPAHRPPFSKSLCQCKAMALWGDIRRETEAQALLHLLAFPESCLLCQAGQGMGAGLTARS